MRIFSWNALVDDEVIADGFVLAKTHKEAEEKLKLAPFYNKYDKVEITDDDDIGCGFWGTEIDENGVAFRWGDLEDN